MPMAAAIAMEIRDMDGPTREISNEDKPFSGKSFGAGVVMGSTPRVVFSTRFRRHLAAKVQPNGE
jgi:hypothetical protein